MRRRGAAARIGVISPAASRPSVPWRGPATLHRTSNGSQETADPSPDKATGPSRRPLHVVRSGPFSSLSSSRPGGSDGGGRWRERRQDLAQLVRSTPLKTRRFSTQRSARPGREHDFREPAADSRPARSVPAASGGSRGPRDDGAERFRPSERGQAADRLVDFHNNDSDTVSRRIPRRLVHPASTAPGSDRLAGGDHQRIARPGAR